MDQVNVEIDEHVRSVSPFGESRWRQTVQIVVKLADGSVKEYFEKGAFGERGREMMLGTYKSESAMHHFAPANVPKPLAWGTCKRDPNEHFYICEFRDMTDDLPDVKKFPALVAKIHRDSMMGPPGRRFGFKVDTHLANIANDNSWSDTWEEWYTGAFEQMLVEEEKSHGADDEFTSLASSMCEKVIPRLLRPLETGGLYIRPCLIHSDLQPEHVKADALTGEPIIFDSCAFWGHNEADLGSWRADRYKLGRKYMDEYHKHVPVSAPKEDGDDRNALYAL
ncbi:MAG: hypothetical protein Q9183_004619 [Haloplaca sp. 2 TL-2023]